VRIVHYLVGGMNYFTRRFHGKDRIRLSLANNFLFFRMA